MDSGRSRAVTVLCPSAAVVVSQTGSTRVPPRAKTGAPLAINAWAICPAISGSLPATIRMVGMT